MNKLHAVSTLQAYRVELGRGITQSGSSTVVVVRLRVEGREHAVCISPRDARILATELALGATAAEGDGPKQ